VSKVVMDDIRVDGEVSPHIRPPSATCVPRSGSWARRSASPRSQC